MSGKLENLYIISKHYVVQYWICTLRLASCDNVSKLQLYVCASVRMYACKLNYSKLEILREYYIFSNLILLYPDEMACAFFSVQYLTLTRQIKIAVDDILMFYFYLSIKIMLDVSSESSAQQRIHLKHQVLFSLKNNEKIFMNVALRVNSVRNVQTKKS